MHLKNNGIDKNIFSSGALHLLFTDKIICNSSDYHNNRVYLTDKGKAYVEQLKIERRNKRNRRIHDWTNTAIALAALIVAIMK